MRPEPLGQDLGNVLVLLGVGLGRRAGLDGDLLLDAVLIGSGDCPQNLGQALGLPAVVGGLPHHEGLVVALELGHEAVLLLLFLVGGCVGPVVPVAALGPSGSFVAETLPGPGHQFGHAVHPPLLSERGALEGRLGILVVRPPSQLRTLEGFAYACAHTQARHHWGPLDLELDARLEQLVGCVRSARDQTSTASSSAEAGLGRGTVRDGGDTTSAAGGCCGCCTGRRGLEHRRVGQARTSLAHRLDDAAGTAARSEASATDPTAVGTEAGRRLLLAARQHGGGGVFFDWDTTNTDAFSILHLPSCSVFLLRESGRSGGDTADNTSQQQAECRTAEK